MKIEINLKVESFILFIQLLLDMIYEEDAILLSLFENYVDDEEELRKLVLRYCQGT